MIEGTAGTKVSGEEKTWLVAGGLKVAQNDEAEMWKVGVKSRKINRDNVT